MKKILAFMGWFMFVTVLSLGKNAIQVTAQTSSSSEKISQFTATYTLEQDTKITVTENLNYFTSHEKHGIYRYIPTKLNNGQKYTINWLSVTDQDNHSIPWQTNQLATQTQAKIGDPDQTFSGWQTYQLTYEIENALTKQQQNEETWWEFYWDITGEDWTFPIEKTSVTLISQHAPIQKVACYSGLHGSDDGLCQAQIIDEHQAKFTYDQPLNGGDNLTIVVAFDQENNQLVFPVKSEFETWTANILEVMSAVWQTINVFVPLVIFILAILITSKINDGAQVFVDDTQISLHPSGPTKRQPLFYRPPQLMFYDPFIGSDFSPSQAGYLTSGIHHYRFVVAEIFWLVDQKYLTVKTATPPQLSWLAKMNRQAYKGKTDFMFKKNSQRATVAALNKLKPQQKMIWDELFKDQQNQVRFSDRVNELVKKMPELQREIETSLQNEGLAIKGQVWPLGLGVVLEIIMLFTGSTITFFLALAGLIILATLIAKTAKQKTALGNYYTSLCKGLKGTIKSGQWYYEIQEKMMWIEAMIPYAVALGVTKELTDKMKDLANDPQVATGTHLANYVLVQSLVDGGYERSLVGSMEKAFGAQHHSLTNGSSGNSSGFSGGSSGGGGGGGGGGSW